MLKIAFYEDMPPWSEAPGGICSYVTHRAFVLGRHDCEVWWCCRQSVARWDAQACAWVDRRIFGRRWRHANPPSTVEWLDHVAGVQIMESPDNVLQPWRLRRARQVVQWHTSPNLREWLNRDPLGPIERLQRHLAWRLRRRVSRKAHRLLAPSLDIAYLQGAYYGIHPDHVTVLPYVFSAEAFRDVPTPAESGGGYVLVAGNLEYFKGFDLLMRGYDRYRERGGRLSLVFAGSAGRLDPDPHARIMMRMTPVTEVLRRWGTDAVRFLGRVSQRDLGVCRAAANGVIVNSRFDAFTLVAGETALSGCPLLLSDRTGWRTQAAMCPGSCMFDPYDPQAVANALDEAEDPHKRVTLMASSRQLAAMISGEELIRKTLQFYGEAASGDRAESR